MVQGAPLVDGHLLRRKIFQLFCSVFDLFGGISSEPAMELIEWNCYNPHQASPMKPRLEAIASRLFFCIFFLDR